MSSMFMFSNEEEIWTTLTSLQTTRYLLGSTANRKNGLIYALGGSNEDGVLDSLEVSYTAKMQLYPQRPQDIKLSINYFFVS